MKVNVNGKEVEAQQIGFKPMIEPFAEYIIDDGRVIRLKSVLTKIFKADATNEVGEPVYSVQTQLVMAVDEKQ